MIKHPVYNSKLNCDENYHLKIWKNKKKMFKQHKITHQSKWIYELNLRVNKFFEISALKLTVITIYS